MIDPIYIRLTHHLEQLGEASKPFAAYLAQFHRALVDQGFTRDEALELTGIMQRSILDSMGKDSEGDPPW